MFYVLSSLIIIFMNYVSYRGLFADAALRPLATHKRALGLFFLTLAMGGAALAFSLRFNFLGPSLRIACSLMLALTFIIFSFVLFTNVVAFAVRPVTKRAFSESRRKFLRLYLDVTILILAFSYFFKGIFNAVKLPEVKAQDIELKELRGELKIAVLTDIHLGDFLGADFARAVTRRVNELDADAVAIVGDIADLPPHRLAEFIAPFNELKSKYGTFYVPGNHEYYNGIDGTLKAIRETTNFKILGNENVRVGGVNLAGVYDIIGFRFKAYEPDLVAALGGRDVNLPTVLLAHQPKFLKYMDESAPVDLVVSGHTHGGQIFPFSLLVRLDQKYVAGLYRANKNTQIYVSRGAGFWGPPVRVMAPSEISLLRLKGEV